MGLQTDYANLHTDQERDYFMQRYHDVISSFGGKTHYDADNRPLLVMHSNLLSSGYDVDGTDQTSFGQFSGRVQQTYKHSVPRFFVPEHGTMFTLALVRFPPTATKEIQYLSAKGAFFFSSRGRHTSYIGDWSSDVCSSDLHEGQGQSSLPHRLRRLHRAGAGRRGFGPRLRDELDQAGEAPQQAGQRGRSARGGGPGGRSDRKSVV